MRLRAEQILAEEWMVALFVVILLIIAYLRYKFPAKQGKMYEAIIHSRMVRQRMREEQLLGSRHSLLLNVIFWIMLSLFIYLVAKYFSSAGHLTNGLDIMIYAGIGIFFIYLIKFLLIQILGRLMDRTYGIYEYLRNVFIFNQVIGIILVPMNIAIALAPKNIALVLIISVLVFYFVMLTVRCIRGLQIGMENHAKSHYLFLYLCMLEILPSAVVIKQTTTIII